MPASTTHRTPLAFIILAAGKGTRMKSSLPKVMHRVAGLPLLEHVLRAAQHHTPEKVITVLSDTMNDAQALCQRYGSDVAIQATQKGTGDAVAAALTHLKDFHGHIIVLLGDTPLIANDIICDIHDALSEGKHAVIAGFTPPSPTGYGRLITNDSGNVTGIIEEKDATDDQRRITLCNSGIMGFDAATLRALLPRISPNNAQNEYYLTDIAAIAHAQGSQVGHTLITSELGGINDRKALAAVDNMMQAQLRDQFMIAGVTFYDPASTYLSADVQIAQDVLFEPNVYVGPGVKIDEGVTVRAFSHLEGVHIKAGATVGPFARLRPGADIGQNAKIGNFVEIKQSTLGAGAKVSHLSYIGDATLGADVNIGAGTITCNYDGVNKFKTVIEDGAFIGSNTALVAPVTIGKNALIGAGSTITNNVPENNLSLTRPEQMIKPKK